MLTLVNGTNKARKQVTIKKVSLGTHTHRFLINESTKTLVQCIQNNVGHQTDHTRLTISQSKSIMIYQKRL